MLFCWGAGNARWSFVLLLTPAGFAENVCSHWQAKHSSVKSHGPAAQGVRLVDASGASGSVGLLQVRTDNAQAIEFGSVCGMNLVRGHLFIPFSICERSCMSLQAAADVVCAQLGYDFGSVSTSPCGSYGGANLCGAAGSPVAMSSLACEGGELDIQECVFSVPDTVCLGHAHDSIVYCGVGGSATGFQEGTTRLLSFDGSPSIDGTGRLELFHGGAWGPVCKSGFTLGSATVACKAMGFAGAQPSAGVSSCGGHAANNYCGTLAPQLSEVACSGQEDELLACPHEEFDDVFCAPEESVLLRCSGDGNTQGRPKKVSAPQAGVAA